MYHDCGFVRRDIMINNAYDLQQMIQLPVEMGIYVPTTCSGGTDVDRLETIWVFSSRPPHFCDVVGGKNVRL